MSDFSEKVARVVELICGRALLDGEGALPARWPSNQPCAWRGGTRFVGGGTTPVRGGTRFVGGGTTLVRGGIRFVGGGTTRVRGGTRFVGGGTTPRLASIILRRWRCGVQLGPLWEDPRTRVSYS